MLSPVWFVPASEAVHFLWSPDAVLANTISHLLTAASGSYFSAHLSSLDLLTALGMLGLSLLHS